MARVPSRRNFSSHILLVITLTTVVMARVLPRPPARTSYNTTAAK
jgi:hypothetical protein